MSPNFRLIHGGGGGSAPPPPPTGHRRRRRRRRHFLADLLFQAISRNYEHLWGPRRSNTNRETAERMTTISRQELGHHYVVSEGEAQRVLNVVRNDPIFYGYSVLHVEKGAVGANRGYFPVLVDLDWDTGNLYLVDEQDLEYAEFGARSSARTVASMLEHQAWAADLMAAAALDPSWVVLWTEYAVACRRCAAAARRLVARAEAM